MVEFALASLVVLPLTIGFADVGRAVYTQNLVASQARQAARYAGLHCAYHSGTPYSNSSVTTYVLAQAWMLDTTRLTLTVNPASGTSCAQPGTPVTVTVHYTYVPVTPVLSQIGALGIPLSGVATIQSQ